MKTAYTQSIIGIGSRELGLLDLGMGRQRRHPMPDVVRFGQHNGHYLVGEGVEQYTTPLERMDFLRLGDSPEGQALTHKTLFDLVDDLPADERRVTVMMGLPVEVMADITLAQTTRRDLRSWLEGTHTVAINTIELTYTVTKVQIMAQPAGTFYAWSSDDVGHWTRTKVDQQALVGICDIGFNTVDLFAVQGGRVHARWTAGESLGMRRAAEVIVQAVQHDYGLSLSLHAADALLHASKPEYFTNGQLVDLGGVVAQARNTGAGRILAFVERHWGRQGGQFGYLLFSGGGAATLRAELLRAYPTGLVMPQPVMANALGLARAGYRALRKYAPYVIGLDPGYGGFKGVRL